MFLPPEDPQPYLSKIYPPFAGPPPEPLPTTVSLSRGEDSSYAHPYEREGAKGMASLSFGSAAAKRRASGGEGISSTQEQQKQQKWAGAGGKKQRRLGRAHESVRRLGPIVTQTY